MRAGPFHFSTMSNIIYPRSPRETMDGWSYLPRYIDKIRLHLAGKLHADYQENFGKGFRRHVAQIRRRHARTDD